MWNFRDTKIFVSNFISKCLISITPHHLSKSLTSLGIFSKFVPGSRQQHRLWKWLWQRCAKFSHKKKKYTEAAKWHWKWLRRSKINQPQKNGLVFFFSRSSPISSISANALRCDIFPQHECDTGNVSADAVDVVVFVEARRSKVRWQKLSLLKGSSLLASVVCRWLCVSHRMIFFQEWADTR